MLRARTLRGGEITLGVTLSKRGTHRRRRRRAPLFDVLVVLTGLATAILLAAPAPDDSIIAETVTGGIPAQTLVRGARTERLLGTYQPGQPYHLEVSLDKDSGRITYDLSGANGPPTGDAMFLLEGPSVKPDYSD